jgi:hypothetical protein
MVTTLARVLWAVAVVACAGCYDATPYSGDEPVDDATPDGGEDEPDVGGEPAGEPCHLDGVDDLEPSQYVIQIRNRECETAVCLHYNLQTFCTHRCQDDGDCADVGRGLCELVITVGDPEIIGQYCVTASASRQE